MNRILLVSAEAKDQVITGITYDGKTKKPKRARKRYSAIFKNKETK